jgi:signal transduction histidine kinase
MSWRRRWTGCNHLLVTAQTNARRSLRLWPRSLAARTALVVILGLVVVQCLGLGIHTLDRNEFVRAAELRGQTLRIMTIYRDLVDVPAEARQTRLAKLVLPRNFAALVAPTPDTKSKSAFPAPPSLRRSVLVNIAGFPLTPEFRPRRIQLMADPDHRLQITALQMPHGSDWLIVSSPLPRPDALQGPAFLAAFLVMTVLAALLTIWAVRRLTAPVRTLAEAAERLGRDVNAPPLPEDGPLEVASAAAAFNTMASRIRRFIEDRTLLLTAIGHDLRTPITRMRLRAEFMEDDEQRAKMLNDLDEMEAMVSATLTFGRNASSTEPLSPVDLPELIRTVLDEAGDAAPETIDRLSYEGPDHLTAQLRGRSFKRVLTNLVSNALKYGDSAKVRLLLPKEGSDMLRVEVLDTGPGIPPEDMERVMQPFQRLETSRNRETGGVGLGLTIARDISRAHGGDLVLANRAEGGARVTVTLPA